MGTIDIHFKTVATGFQDGFKTVMKKVTLESCMKSNKKQTTKKTKTHGFIGVEDR